MRSTCLIRFRLLLFVCAAVFAFPLLAADQPKPPTISADAGPCSVDFKVTDTASKPLFNAKVSTQVRFGFGSFHRTDLEVGTDVNGRARFEGIPQKVKRVIEFQVRYNGRSTGVIYDPGTNCHASFDAVIPDEKR